MSLGDLHCLDYFVSHYITHAVFQLVGILDGFFFPLKKCQFYKENNEFLVAKKSFKSKVAFYIFIIFSLIELHVRHCVKENRDGWMEGCTEGGREEII